MSIDSKKRKRRTSAALWPISAGREGRYSAKSDLSSTVEAGLRGLTYLSTSILERSPSG